MKCNTTAVPPSGVVDIPALKDKYRRERDKRIRREGQEQYAPRDDTLTHDSYEHDPFMPVVPRDALHELDGYI
jgi:hypothetical protein